MPQRIRMLSGDQVRRLLPMALAIDEMTNAFTALASGHAEMPEALVASAKVVVDDTDACLSETADLILPIRHGLMTREDIYAQLGELTTEVLPGRTTAQETTLFKSVGLAIQDLAAAAAILQAAEAEDAGTVVEI